MPEVATDSVLEVGTNSVLEVTANLPDRAGVRVLLHKLRGSGIPASVGKVCGSRVSAVYLGAAFQVVSVTLEPFELDDAALALSKTAAFIEEVRSLENKASLALEQGG